MEKTFTVFIASIGLAAAAFTFAIFLAPESRVEAQSANNTARNPLSYELLYSSITATGSVGATGLATTTTPCAVVSFTNTTNVEIDTLIGPSGAVTTKHRVPAGAFHEYNLGAAETRWPTATIVKVYSGGTTGPTGGAFEFLCQPY